MLLITSLKGPVLVDPPIKTHDDLMVRIEQKFIGFRSPLYGWMEPPKMAVVDWVTPEYKPFAIDYLKVKAKDPKYLERAQRALIALNDEETLVEAIKHFSDGTLEPPSILSQNIKGDKIKYLIPVIYEGSEVPRRSDIGGPVSPRYHAMEVALLLIRFSGLFHDPVDHWGFRLHTEIVNFGADPHIMWLFQQWWEHNKVAILAEKYSEATWLPTFKGEPDDFNESVRNDPDYRNYTAATRNDILPIPKHASIVPEIKAAPSVTKAAPAVAPTQENDSLFILLSLGFLIILASAWVWFKRSNA